MNAQDAFGIVAMLYAVAHLQSAGLELKLRETIQSLLSVCVLGLTLGWGWLTGPAFAVLLTKTLPMDEPYAVGLLASILAPTSSAQPMFIYPDRPGGHVVRCRAHALGGSGVPLRLRPGPGTAQRDVVGGLLARWWGDVGSDHRLPDHRSKTDGDDSAGFLGAGHLLVLPSKIPRFPSRSCRRTTEI